MIIPRKRAHIAICDADIKCDFITHFIVLLSVNNRRGFDCGDTMSKGSTKVKIESVKQTIKKDSASEISFVPEKMSEPHFSFSILQEFVSETNGGEIDDIDDWSCEFPYFTGR